MHPHDTHRKAFVRLAQSLSRQEGWTQYDAFRAFLEAGYRSIRGAFLHGDAWQQNEDEYMKIVRRCRHPKETMAALVEMMGHTVEALEAKCEDFLGPVYMDIGGSKDHGQFFTPHELSSLIARVNMPDLGEMIAASPRGYFTAHEPAAGMGGMVLAVAEIMREQGFEPARHCHWQMIDVEFKAMAGCYIQTSLAGVSGIVVHGNALTLQEWAYSLTPTAWLFPKRFDIATPAPTEPIAVPAIEAPEPIIRKVSKAAPPKAGQMAFDFTVPPNMAERKST